MKHLYIIGNGFDLHHGIHSKYLDYAKWLEETYPDIYCQVENAYLIQDKELWKDFEHMLGELDVRYHADRITSDRYPSKKELEDSSDREFEDMKEWYRLSSDEARDEFEELFNNIRSSFREWVEQLNAPDEAKKLPIEKEGSIFLTFNYTDTLETLYRVPEEKIIYIHGKAMRGDELILGHGLMLKDIQDLNGLVPPEDFDTPEQIEEFYRNHGDVVIDETFDEVCNQLAQQAKPVVELKDRLLRYLSGITGIEHIHIFGFSFSDIDMLYIQVIATLVDLKSVRWEVSYFAKEERNEFIEALTKCGVPEEMITTVKLDDIKRYYGCKWLF